MRVPCGWATELAEYHAVCRYPQSCTSSPLGRAAARATESRRPRGHRGVPGGSPPRPAPSGCDRRPNALGGATRGSADPSSDLLAGGSAMTDNSEPQVSEEGEQEVSESQIAVHWR